MTDTSERASTARRYVVTGGAGFIGSHVVQALLDKGEKVLVVDHKAPNAAIPHHVLDIRDMNSLRNVLVDSDVLIHLAACVGVDDCLDQPSLVQSVNTGGTEAVLAAARAAGVRRMVFSSSSEIYGDGYGRPFHEFLPPAPKSPYGRAKIEAERLLATAADQQLSVRVVRLFNVYGPGQSSSFVVPRFLDRALRGEELTIYGDGTQLRCYTYVADAVAGLLLAAQDEGAIFDVFNIGLPEPRTVRELADVVLRVTRSASELSFLALGTDTRRSADVEIYHRVPDVHKAQDRLGFAPSVTLHDGLLRMISHICADDVAAPELAC